jgi:CDP-diacylglycerol pyrophosphatase
MFFSLSGGQLLPRRFAGLMAVLTVAAPCAAVGLKLAAPIDPAPGGPRGEALWRIVDGGCNHGAAAIAGLRCVPARGYAVMKDRCGPSHYLLLPLARRTGIESPELQRADEPNYFQDAWDERGVVAVAAPGSGQSDDEIGLAINARLARGQSQLHIHIDWVRPEVRAALRAAGQTDSLPSTLELQGHAYRLLHVGHLDPSPFRTVAAALGDAGAERGFESIAVIADGGSGFYVLGGRVDPLHLDFGHAEDLLIPRACGG